MTGIRPKSPLTRWALEQLKLPASGDAAAARRQFLARLPEESFTPTGWQHQAIRALVGQAALPMALGQAVLEEEQRAREEVEAFASEYFNLAPKARKQRWLALHERCASLPAMTTRLLHLKRGLDVVLPVGDDMVVRLAAEMGRLYVMPGSLRPAARSQFIKNIPVRTEQWDRAAVELRAQQRPIYEMEPILVERLIDWQRDQGRRRDRLHQQQRAASAPLESPNGFSAAYVLIVIALACVRALSGGCSSSSSPPTKSTWRIEQTTPAFSPDEIQKILDGMPVKPELDLRKQLQEGQPPQQSPRKPDKDNAPTPK